jgi:ABC-type enterochelin transport system permease subunit
MFVLSGAVMFSAGLIGTTMMRNTFETAIMAGIIGMLAMGALRSLGTSSALLAGYAVTIVLFVLAGRDLFLCREPFEWHALRLRAFVWLMGILGILVAVNGVG